MSAIRFIIGLKTSNRRIALKKLKTVAPESLHSSTKDQVLLSIAELRQELLQLVQDENRFINFALAAMDQVRTHDH